MTDCLLLFPAVPRFWPINYFWRRPRTCAAATIRTTSFPCSFVTALSPMKSVTFVCYESSRDLCPNVSYTTWSTNPTQTITAFETRSTFYMVSLTTMASASKPEHHPSMLASECDFSIEDILQLKSPAQYQLATRSEVLFSSTDPFVL